MDLNFRAGTHYIGSGPKKRCLPQMSSYRCNIRSTGQQRRRRQRQRQEQEQEQSSTFMVLSLGVLFQTSGDM